MLAAGLATVKYGVMPKVAEYRADILSRVSAASGMDVNAKTMRGGWSGFTPFVEMEEVTFREPPNVKSVTRAPGATALVLPLVRGAVSIPRLFNSTPCGGRFVSPQYAHMCCRPKNRR